MKIAQKITDVLTTNAVCMTYHESLIVLRIVMSAIRDITGEETNK